MSLRPSNGKGPEVNSEIFHAHQLSLYKQQLPMAETQQHQELFSAMLSISGTYITLMALNAFIHKVLLLTLYFNIT